jgi:hypothetical protein
MPNLKFNFTAMGHTGLFVSLGVRGKSPSQIWPIKILGFRVEIM